MTIDRNSGTKEITKELSRRVKEYRITAKMTQDELADKAMVSRKTLSRFENGSDIGLNNLAQILHALNLSKNFEMLVPNPDDRPSYYIPERKNKKRVRHSSGDDVNGNFIWGEDRI